MTMKSGIAMAAMLWVAVSAHAELNCTNPPDQLTMNQCASRAYTRSDADLNQVYKTATGRLKDDKDTAAKLVHAQRAWIAYRDAECAFSTAATEGGSVNEFSKLTCLDAQTKIRTTALKDYLKCPEGDVTCPIPPQ
jgi:uncharacterized protein YecT (DUF1311 family)